MIDKIRGKDLGFWFILVLILLFLMLLIGYCTVTGKSIKEVSDIKDLLKDVLLMLVAYRWGSSRGSKDKTELLNRQSGPGTN